jgi:hypothetical protein
MKRAPQLLDAGHQGCVTHFGLGPYSSEHLVFGDDFPGALGQESQERTRLGRQPNFPLASH